MAPMKDTQTSSHEGSSTQSDVPHSAYTVNPLASATQDTNNTATSSNIRTLHEAPGDFSHAALDTTGTCSELGTNKYHGCESPQGDKELPPSYTSQRTKTYGSPSFRPYMNYAPPGSVQQDDQPPGKLSAVQSRFTSQKWQYRKQ